MNYKIKFFLTPIYPYGNDHYYHEMIAIAEGFKELGFKLFGNVNYWWQPETKSYLINDENENTDFDIAIYDYRYVTSFAHLLFREGYPNFDKNKIHILIDRNDWLKPIWWKNNHYNIFKFIFAGNLYSNIKYADNIKPWAIGLTNRIINSIDAYYNPENNRDQVVGYNFRVDHNMRGYVLNNLINGLKKYPAISKFTEPNFDNETDALYNKYSINRHNPLYYKCLCNTGFFMAFGGYYEYKPVLYLQYSFLDKIKRKPFYWKYLKLKKENKDFSETVFVFQHDNFRFWEVLYSGSIAINLDLDFWNFKLPEMPIPNKHYIGIQKLIAHSVESDLNSIDKEKIKSISTQARKWVHENYSPVAQAKRIMSYINRNSK